MALGIYEEEDIRAIAISIRDNSGLPIEYTTKDMPNGIKILAQNSHDEGEKEGYDKGKTDGITEGIEQGKTEAYAEVEPINTQLENTLNGTDTGGKSYYDEFWDGVFSGYNWQCKFYGSSWNDKTFYPNQDIKPTHCANNLFALCEITDLPGRLEECEVVLDTSGVTGRCDALFNYATKLTRAPYVDASNSTMDSYGINNMYANCSELHTIVGIKIKNDGSQSVKSIFDNCYKLENITIEGVIGQNGFNVQWSTKLSKASIISIINALSTTTSGLSVTLSKTAVETAFGSTESEEWIALINTRSNWTINLV